MRARQVSISLAAFVLICFFLPWVELSCTGLRDSVSGYDLARSTSALWFIPAFMVAVILLGIAKVVREKRPSIFALAASVGGGISAFLMYRERVTPNESAGLIAARMTVWYWLGVFAALGLIAAAFAFYGARSRAP